MITALHPPGSGRASIKGRRALRKTMFGLSLTVAMIVVLLPVYWIVISAFTPTIVLSSPSFNFLPLHWSLANFKAAFSVVPALPYFWHSVVLATVPAVLAIVVALPASYAFGRLRFRGSSLLLAVIVFTGFLPIVVSIIPLFELFKALNLIGTWWAMFLLYTGFLLGFTTWIMSVFMARIPVELEEAARLDGAGDLAVMRWVIAPLLRPAIASIFIVNFLASWNQFLLPVVFSVNSSTAPLVLGITQASENPQLHSVLWGPQAAFGLIVLAPAVIVVLIFQRRITEGITAGALKA